ncbi:VRR-NUC domain-containing protein [Motilimonas sp. E26]|uniref:VRR-NUC domain-containing protein n=1 Tax=Motilimonas sp. E26 TaxID=2865674 RepID=UPI001E50719D|nr:VRR-NUC domain-containing protein [Motilimonas sp. E26]MCE0559153.1 VRR-NUC domain-containing protein [Motilimonas sp. E26]
MLKQNCVAKGLDWMRDSGQGRNILPEVGYYMGGVPAPVPLLLDGPAVPERIKNHWHRFNKVRKLLAEDGVEKYSKGLLRIPDIVITEQPDQIPIQPNIKQVVEIKFPGDKWGAGQKDAYETIAGEDDFGTPKLTELNTNKCGCGDKKQPIANPVPALTNAWQDELDRQQSNKLVDIGIVVGGTLLGVAMILDDFTGIGAADDPFIPIVSSAVARSSVRLLTLGSLPVAVPILAN